MSGSADEPRSPRPVLGVLVPCHGEAAVIERKLENLARIRWPECARPHVLMVVDDGSQDGTGELARRALARHFGARCDVRASVAENRERPGKAGAIAQGLEDLGEVDLVVLSDADVVCEPDALCELAAVFDGRPELGMASGAQRFVRDLASDGTALGADGCELVAAGDLYDRVTARVRALESARGALFSIHGQWLAWRAALALRPAPGLAADDLDLMLQVRELGSRVELVPRARFLEVKAPAGAARAEQAVRRARAYVQCVRGPRFARALARARGIERLQLCAYRWLPLASPWILASVLALALLAVGAWLGPQAAFALALALAVLAASAAGRDVLRIGRAIVRAARLESAAPLADRWQTARR